MARFCTIAVLLMALAALQPVLGVRRLEQTSGNCPLQIPHCADSRCSLQLVDGKTQSVCERCQAKFTPTANGLNCICPPGTYLKPNGTSHTCAPCEKGFWCEGGDKFLKNGVNDAKVGQRRSCEGGAVIPAAATNVTSLTIMERGLTTKANRQRRHTDCVPMPGFFLAATTKATQTAQLCPPNTYSTGYNRLRQCLKCQSGTEEPLKAFTSNLTEAIANPSKLRKNNLEVCQVGDGRYLVQNVVRDCPAGTFRSGSRMTTESAARYCFPCPTGLSTRNPRAAKPSDCNVVQAGLMFTSQSMFDAQTQAQDVNSTFPDADLCPYGTYFEGGTLTPGLNQTCKPCPMGTTTQSTGSTSITDCMVPPGYFIKVTTTGSSGSMEKCPTNIGGKGYYRAGWVAYSDVRVQETGSGTTVCNACGTNIKSAYTDIDERGGGDNVTALVAASSFSCYIEAGWGMVPTGTILPNNLMEFKAELCAANSYGVANTTYGLLSAPCKPCMRNLVTLTNGSTSYTQCVNPDGFGWSSGGGNPCPAGYWSNAGSLLPCTKCPPGRTTNVGAPADQNSPEDCYVLEGYGVYDGTNTTDPWSFPVPSNATIAAGLPVMPCPIGYYSAGGSVSTQCTACADGYTTTGEGSTSKDDCTKCKPGWGKQDTDCKICPAGTYQAGYFGNDGSGNSPASQGNGETCVSCAKTTYVYLSSKGKEAEFTSSGVTYRPGAMGREECVPRTAQVGIDIGQRLFNDASMMNGVEKAKTLNDCMAACESDKCCFVQFDYGYFGKASTCLVANLVPNTDANEKAPLLFYKMLPSDAIAAASVGTEVKIKAMSSGLYARCDIPAEWSEKYYKDVGKDLGVSVKLATSSSLAECKTKCDMMSTCWGFTVKDMVCTLRGGTDAQDVRSFYQNPKDPSSLKW